MNTEYILNLQRECRESDRRHKLSQAKYRQQHDMLNFGIDVMVTQIAYNTMAMFNGALRDKGF